jgi:hypothetical protein
MHIHLMTEAAASANPIKNWYLLNKHRVAPRYLAGLVALSFSIRCITPIVLYATMDDISAPVGSDDCSFIVADAVSNGILIFFAVCFSLW